ncbi:hypothetical protein HSB1_32910 [Halogranum salarium B-1]|uniref:Uncharacterized protein n=1 Tax=Halogranum salarium B-1 TaxID=1210908 RepID=J3JDX7_9EURY|nr:MULTISPECIES: hypothetical protein [Halogranum]EJN57874.1 hypothetical protein HSB1_32910 [Halogranum salarium B-1]
MFGDNDRVVRSCPSCRGTAPEPASTENVVAETGTRTDVETHAPSVSADGGERIEEDEPLDETETEPSLTAESDDGLTSDPVDERQGTSTGVGNVDVAEPETAAAAGTDRSPLGFLRSVFSR